MKKDRITRNMDIELYKKLDEKCTMDDTRYYGLFEYSVDNKKRFKLDPKRYSKIIGLTEEQIICMNKRNVHYFFPRKIDYFDYNCNIIISEIDGLVSEWQKDFKPMIDSAIKKIKEEKELSPGDYYNFQCGISGAGSANAWASFTNMQNQQKTCFKRIKLFTSLYSQFFHYMVSKIEAVTLSVFTKNGFEGDRFERNILYAAKIGGNLKLKLNIKELPHHSEYEKMYCVWNFIKHNSLSTYNTLKGKYPDTLRDEKYLQGEQAIFYVIIDEKTINDTLSGVKAFFKEYCAVVFDENYEEAQWNYDGYFKDKVKGKIEEITNPLGLGWWDECD